MPEQPLGGSSGTDQPGLRGQLLVATPALGDPRFRRTVVYLLAHTPDGALGVVLNRPAELPVAVALPAWADLAAEPATVFTGGPVGQSSAICLAEVLPGSGPLGWSAVAGRIGTFDIGADFAGTREALVALRVFSGYAGWGGAQLDGEIAEGSWYVVPAEPGDALTPEPDSLWRRVLRRQPGHLAMVATFPDDPTLN